MSKTVSLTSKQVSRGLISFLDKTKRLGLLSQVLREAQKSTKTYTDPNLAVVESAVALTPEQLSSISSYINFQRGKETEIVNKVNQNLIAGIKIKIGDTVIDQSLSHQIDQLAAKVHE